MKAKFFLFGRAVDMSSRRRRRWLVVLVYTGLTALMTGFWYFDHWKGQSMVFLFCAASLANSIFFGGIGFGGLIRPFINRPTFRMPAPAVRLLRWGLRPIREASASDLRNDERELQQRDRVHYQAYRALIAGLFLLWFLCIWALLEPNPPAIGLIPANMLLYGLVMALIVVSLTLPQAILLWTEPDMEGEG